MSKMIQIRHVPDEVHRTLKARAAQEMTLSDYLLREVRQLTGARPTVALRARDAREPVVFDPPPEVIIREMRGGDRRRRLGRTSLVAGGPGSEPLWKRVTAPRRRCARARTSSTSRCSMGSVAPPCRPSWPDARLAVRSRSCRELQAVGIPTAACSATYALRHGERLRRVLRLAGRSTPRSSRWTPRALGVRRVRELCARADSGHGASPHSGMRSAANWRWCQYG